MTVLSANGLSVGAERTIKRELEASSMDPDYGRGSNRSMNRKPSQRSIACPSIRAWALSIASSSPEAETNVLKTAPPQASSITAR